MYVAGGDAGARLVWEEMKKRGEKSNEEGGQVEEMDGLIDMAGRSGGGLATLTKIALGRWRRSEPMDMHQ